MFKWICSQSSGGVKDSVYFCWGGVSSGLQVYTFTKARIASEFLSTLFLRRKGDNCCLCYLCHATLNPGRGGKSWYNDAFIISLSIYFGLAWENIELEVLVKWKLLIKDKHLSLSSEKKVWVAWNEIINFNDCSNDFTLRRIHLWKQSSCKLNQTSQ